MSVGGRFLLTWFGLLVCACMGACTGLFGGLSGWLATEDEVAPQAYPYPHHIPKQPDGVSLRFAMVHDVLHERFPRHGIAYYKERNRRVDQALTEWKERGEAPSEKYFALLDDRAVGLEFVGEHDEAIRVMRDKLKQQQALGLTGRHLYSTYANLGTFLILGPFRLVRPGNEDDKRVLHEGLDLIRSSIEVNPDAHFGREIWQAALVEYMIALLDKPELLLQYDMLGNALDAAVDPSKARCIIDPEKYGAYGEDRAAQALLATGSPTWASRSALRDQITRVGAEEFWRKPVPSTALVPFDEPTLGIIGMWRLGGGAHPYFALALGETMLRVGQRYIAWSAYERAGRLASLAWPEPQMQQQFAALCRKRQALIEGQLPPETVAKLRPAFEKELARGEDYQRAYQRYEEQQIAAGKSLEDPHFYDAFHADHGSIASPVGPEDQFAVERHAPVISVPAILLCAGLGTLIGSGIVCLLAWWRRPLRQQPVQSP
jgi:hypothetical protein